MEYIAVALTSILTPVTQGSGLVTRVYTGTWLPSWTPLKSYTSQLKLGLVNRCQQSNQNNLYFPSFLTPNPHWPLHQVVTAYSNKQHVDLIIICNENSIYISSWIYTVSIIVPDACAEESSCRISVISFRDWIMDKSIKGIVYTSFLPECCAALLGVWWLIPDVSGEWESIVWWSKCPANILIMLRIEHCYLKISTWRWPTMNNSIRLKFTGV